MEKKRKKKINILKVIIFLLLVYLIYFVIKDIFSTKTKNIIISNNNYYSDEVIIETAKIENYPKFITLNKSVLKKRLLKLDLIDEIKISKKYGYILKIDVTEKKILYYSLEKNMYMCSDNEFRTLDVKESYPVLINFVPSDIQKKFIKSFSLVNEDIIKKISEIEYNVTSYDDERFIFYMNDGNEVIININKMQNINKYTDIVTKLDNKKGILYLDTGNYFEIKE